jgi:hypothetical protein
MPAPKATNEYGHGQMMGMLVIIQLFENARDDKRSVDGRLMQRIKEIATRDLSEYLEKPEEDVLLLVNEQLRSVS